MAWPPVVPPTTRTNQTPQLDTHVNDHNQLAAAVAQLVALVPAAGALPWGRVAYGTSTASTAGISADTDVISVTFPAVAGRRYRVTGGYGFVVGATGINGVFCKLTDGANAVLNQTVITALANGFYTMSTFVEVAPGAAGNRTYKLRASCNQQTITLQGAATQLHQLLVEDIGI